MGDVFPGTDIAKAIICQRIEVRGWEVSFRICSFVAYCFIFFLPYSGWEQRYTGLSDSDLTTHSLDSRIRPRHSLSPDKDFMGDFADSDMESVVSVTSSAFSTQSERPRGSKGIR